MANKATKKERKEILLKILENASNIQYYMNVMESGDWMEKWDDHMYLISHEDEQFGTQQMFVPVEMVKFYFKGRKLKSGLSNPMARYYGYRALSKM